MIPDPRDHTPAFEKKRIQSVHERPRRPQSTRHQSHEGYVGNPAFFRSLDTIPGKQNRACDRTLAFGDGKEGGFRASRFVPSLVHGRCKSFRKLPIPGPDSSKRWARWVPFVRRMRGVPKRSARDLLSNANGTMTYPIVPNSTRR